MSRLKEFFSIDTSGFLRIVMYFERSIICKRRKTHDMCLSKLAFALTKRQKQRRLTLTMKAVSRVSAKRICMFMNISIGGFLLLIISAEGMKGHSSLQYLLRMSCVSLASHYRYQSLPSSSIGPRDREKTHYHDRPQDCVSTMSVLEL